MEALVDAEEVVAGACNEIVERTAGRKAVLIFAASVDHGGHVARILREEHGLDVGEVYGTTSSDERRQTLDACRSGDLKYVVNVNVLSLGFDAPNIDCVCMLRPTLSGGLYYQQVGRGFRIHPGKTDCLVLDYAGNIFEHGPVDQIVAKENIGRNRGSAPVRTCPECLTVCHAACKTCPDCGYSFVVKEDPKHSTRAAVAEIVSSGTTSALPVSETRYSVWVKRGAAVGHPPTMRVDYYVESRRWPVSEWAIVLATSSPPDRASRTSCC